MNYKIVTVSNRRPAQSYYCYDQFYKSLQGITPLVLGQHGYQGLGDKPKFLYRAIKDGLIKEPHIIFCDSWDLVFASHPDEVYDRFFSFNTHIVISSEKNCFPADLKGEYDKLPSTSSYKYLNSGMIVGETDAIFHALEVMDAENLPNDYVNPNGSMTHINDQALWMELFLKQPVPMVLDYKQELCNTLHSVHLEDLDFSETRIENKETGSYPCSLHFNGNSKTSGLREPLLKHLNL